MDSALWWQTGRLTPCFGGWLGNTVYKVDADHIDPMIPVPLGRSAGETAPVVCVETPDCDVVEEELQKVNRSHSTGCLTGCRPRCFPSCLSCQPLGIESRVKTWHTTLSVKEHRKAST